MTSVELSISITILLRTAPAAQRFLRRRRHLPFRHGMSLLVRQNRSRDMLPHSSCRAAFSNPERGSGRFYTHFARDRAASQKFPACHLEILGTAAIAQGGCTPIRRVRRLRPLAGFPSAPLLMPPCANISPASADRYLTIRRPLESGLLRACQELISASPKITESNMRYASRPLPSSSRCGSTIGCPHLSSPQDL